MRGRKLSDFIDDYILERGDVTKHDKPRLMRMAVRGLQECWIDVNGYPKIIIASVNEETQAVQIPEDMISEPVISIPAGNKVIPVPHTSSASKFAPAVLNSFGEPTLVENRNQGADEPSLGYGSFNAPDWLPNHYRNFEFKGAFFGNGGGSIFTHQVNESAGLIEFSSDVRGYVIIEYMGLLPKSGKDFLIHPNIEETIMAWLNWVKIRSLTSVTPNEKDYYKREYFRAKRWAKIRYSMVPRNNQVEAKTSAMNQTTRF